MSAQSPQQCIMSPPAGSVTQQQVTPPIGSGTADGAQQQQQQQPINVDEMKKAYAALGLQYNPNNTPPSPQINQPLTNNTTTGMLAQFLFLVLFFYAFIKGPTPETTTGSLPHQHETLTPKTRPETPTPKPP